MPPLVIKINALKIRLYGPKSAILNPESLEVTPTCPLLQHRAIGMTGPRQCAFGSVSQQKSARYPPLVGLQQEGFFSILPHNQFRSTESPLLRAATLAGTMNPSNPSGLEPRC